MKLVKLTKDSIKLLRGRALYCYEYSPAYLEELAGRLRLAGRIRGVIDDNQRNQGERPFGGGRINVHGSGHLAGQDLGDCTFVITSDYVQEAYERLSQVLSGIGYYEDVYYFLNSESETEMSYRKKYRDRPLKDLVVFRSGPHASAYIKGTDFSDNARALFEYMLRVGLNRKYRLVWLVKEPQEFTRYAGSPNVEFLPFDWCASEKEEERDVYYGALFLAKYIFFTDAYGFARNCREGQIRVQLWHGCGFKTRVSFARCERRYEYTTVISDLYAEIHARVYGLRPDQILVTGYAKEDWLFSPRRDPVEALGLPKAGKYVFWLPTFREAKGCLGHLAERGPGGDTGLPLADSREKLEMLDRLLGKEGIFLVIKPHPFQETGAIRCEGLANIRVAGSGELFEKDIETNELLSCADALISDYSSAAVDFLLLDRPMAFALTDVEEYQESRGFVFDNIKDWLPGKELYEFPDLCGFLGEVASGADPAAGKRRSLLGKMHRYHDGQNSRRIVEALGIAP